MKTKSLVYVTFLFLNFILVFLVMNNCYLEFDPVGNPSFEVMTAPPNPLPVPSPAFDTHRNMNPSAILQPTISAPQSADLSQSSSPRFSPPLHSPLPPPLPLPLQAPSLQQRVGEEGQPRLALPPSQMQRQQVLTAPLRPNLQPLPNRFRDIFNSRIRAEGFEFIERRFTVSRRKRSRVSSKGKRSLRFGDSGSSDYVEKFLSVNNSPVRRIRDAQSSDENNSVPDSTSVEGSGDINNEVPIFPSSTNLQKESAYQASVTQISSGNSRSDNMIVETEPRLGLEETDTTRNSFSDEGEGSAVSENARMLEENAGVGVSKEITENSLIDDSLLYSIWGIPRGHPPHENSIEVSAEEEEQDKEQPIDDSLQINVKLPNSSENRSSASMPPSVSSNSVSCEYIFYDFVIMT